MRKKSVILFFMFFAVTGSSQVVKQGTIIFTGYYGYPHLWTIILNEVFKDTFIEDDNTLKMKGFGTLGLKFEYLLNDKIGIGLESNYFKTTAQQFLYYTSEATRFRIMPRFNFHFIRSKDRWDGYFLVAAGCLIYKKEEKSTHPDYPSSVNSYLLPALRGGLGFSYFFTKAIGANIEHAIGGGPVLTIGLTAKF